MITKLAKDLVKGDIFIDPNRAGRRPARLEFDPETGHSSMFSLGEERTFMVLNDWTSGGLWSASYSPSQELEIVTEKEAIDQTVRNQIEHRAQMTPWAKQYHQGRFAASNPTI